MPYRIFNIRDNPNYLETMVDYYTSKWNLNRGIWFDLIADCITTQNPLPRWYLMMDGEDVVGCVGLMDDGVPGIAGLYVEEHMRGEKLGALLLEHALNEAKNLGFSKMSLTTYHEGYFEKYGWEYIDNMKICDNKVRFYEKQLRIDN